MSTNDNEKRQTNNQTPCSCGYTHFSFEKCCVNDHALTTSAMMPLIIGDRTNDETLMEWANKFIDTYFPRSN
jgi:hypothetical protein